MTTSLPNILKQTEEYILGIYNKKGNTKLLFHDFRRVSEIIGLIQDIGNYSGYNAYSDEAQIAKIAAWFHTLGILNNYSSPIVTGKIEAQKYLREKGFPAPMIHRVVECLESLDLNKSPISDEAQLLHDATLAYWSTSNHYKLAPLKRLEEELILDKKYTHGDWEQQLLDSMLQSRFYSSYGQMVFSPILNQNIIDQKKRVDNILLKKKGKTAVEEGMIRKFQGLESKYPMRGAQTFFRSVYRNHINLSAIADNKANMMTGINAILISVILSIVTYGRLIYDKPETMMPIAIFVLTALVSLIFSIAAASPRVTKVNKNAKSVIQARKNIAFFGNFSSLNLDEFEEAMDAMLRDDELLYGNMSRDLYFLGKALDKKYKLLRISYHVFLGGFVVSVLLFSYFVFAA